MDKNLEELIETKDLKSVGTLETPGADEKFTEYLKLVDGLPRAGMKVLADYYKVAPESLDIWEKTKNLLTISLFILTVKNRSELEKSLFTQVLPAIYDDLRKIWMMGFLTGLTFHKDQMEQK